MVARSASETTAQSRTLVAQKNNELLKPLKQAGLSKGLVKARNTQDKSFKKDLDRIRIRCPDSENFAFGSSVPECVETTWSNDSVEYNSQRNITSNYYNGQAVNLANHFIALSESESRSKFLEVTPIVSVPTDRDVVNGHEEDITEQYIDQKSYASLKANINALKGENRRLRSKLQDGAEISLQLKNENTILLDNLRQKCPPDVIASLEAENPDREMP